MNKWSVAIKAVRVVRSCETLEQLIVARKYCKQVIKWFWFPWQKKDVSVRLAKLIAKQSLELKGGSI